MIKLNKTKFLLRIFSLVIFFASLFYVFESKQSTIHAQAVTPPTFVSTFHSIGIYWNPNDGSSGNQSSIEYRVVGSSIWEVGFPLWYDSRSLTVAGKSHSPEYRGSLANLQPGTNYEIKLTLNSGTTITSTASTWGESFPIAETIPVSNMNTTLTISQSGSSDGYLLFDGQSSTINVNKESDHNIVINGSYVIIRGFKLINARKDAIEIGEDVHHVIIEENEISLWASSGDYSGDMRSAAIRTSDDTYSQQNHNVKNIIIQRNKIFNPSIDSTYWDESSANPHPAGPVGIALFNTGGNHVIRYNEIYSANGNYFMDILGAGSNRSFEGFPTSDTDIYSNFLSHAWDDAIETEGANMNVRVWGNYINKTYVAHAIASTTVGPLYIWRNISNIGQKDPNITEKGDGAFVKSGDKNGNYGQVYLFHNTLLQPQGSTDLLGYRIGIAGWGGSMRKIYSRNNILHARQKGVEGGTDPSNSFDYDLFNSDLQIPIGQEQNGINGVPSYATSNDLFDGKGDFTLNINSPGYNDGLVIPNFNDSSAESVPDMGAHEANTPPMEFGINAYRITPTPTPTPSPPPSPTPTPGPPQGDINEDGLVDSVDMQLILDVWGEITPGNENKDLNSDGWVNSLDAGVVIKDWTGGGETPVSLERRVSQGTDDAEECLVNTLMYIDSSDLELTSGTSSCASAQSIGIRFQNITIPQGATVINAYLEFTVDEIDTESTNLVFHGENTDNSSTFVSAYYNITNRPKTSSYVSWDNVPSWTTVGATHQTPDLTSIIQEIINRPSWQSGNALAIIVSGTGQRTAEAYEGSPSQASLLHIDY